MAEVNSSLNYGYTYSLPPVSDPYRNFIKVNKTKRNTNDILDLSSKKKSNTKKIALGILAAAGIALTTSMIICHHNLRAFKPLAEKIIFKKAKTIEEAKAFAMTHFKVKNYELDDLSIANYVNQSLVNLSNRYKGRLPMPQTIKPMDKALLASYPGAGALIYTTEKSFGKIEQFLAVNCEVGKLNCCINLNGLPMDIFPQFMGINSKTRKIVERFQRGYQLSLADSFKLHSLQKTLMSYLKNSKAVFDDLRSQPEFVNLVKSKLNIDVKRIDISQKRNVDVALLITDLEKKLCSAGVKVVDIPKPKNILYKYTPSEIIYHEMGHVLHHKEVHFILDEPGRGRLMQQRHQTPEAQEIAEKVSWYAKTHPEEFVADVYAGLCAGSKYPDDVMQLYSEYYGPKIPSLI